MNKKLILMGLCTAFAVSFLSAGEEEKDADKKTEEVAPSTDTTSQETKETKPVSE